MRALIILLLLLFSPHSYAKGTCDCAPASEMCEVYNGAADKSVQTSGFSCESVPPDEVSGEKCPSICWSVDGVCMPEFRFPCNFIPEEEICPSGEPPFEGWFPADTQPGADGTYCDGNCKVKPDDNPPVPGFDAGGVAADFVKGKTKGEECENPCGAPNVPNTSTCPIPDYDPVSPDPKDCPDGYRPGKCDDFQYDPNTACTDVQGANGTWCYADLKNPKCADGQTTGDCAPPGEDSPFPDNPDGSDPGGNPTNPGGSGSDPTNPTGGSPTGGSPGGAGGTGGTGGTDGSGLKGKDPDKDGNCGVGYVPTLDKSTKKTYCRPTGTSEPDADGNCSDGWMKAALDSRFCVKKPKQPTNCAADEFYEEGTGCKKKTDKCPKGKVENPATKECVVQIEADVDAGPAKPGAITMFEVCKQNPDQLTSEIKAICASGGDDAMKAAQTKKDTAYLDGLVKAFTDFVKSDTKNISVDKFDVTQLYSGVFAPFETFIKQIPECPLATIEVSSFDLFGAVVDFSKIFKGEYTKLPCDMLALVRVLFLLGVYYLGFRLIFKALTGV